MVNEKMSLMLKKDINVEKRSLMMKKGHLCWKIVSNDEKRSLMLKKDH